MATKYRLSPYSKDPPRKQTSYRETSTQTESSRTELWKELLDLVQEDSQPCWCQKESDSDSQDTSASDASLLSLGESWSDEENPGGEGPPLVPPEGGAQWPSSFRF
nr:ORF3 [Torque teno Leptonychotes weddellii virus 2]WCS66103.1 ORF3 [Torque teno Leptonychotes weddellii virus 2]